MLFLTLPNWSGLAGWPAAEAMRRLNCSRRSFRSSSCSSAGVRLTISLKLMSVPRASRSAHLALHEHGRQRQLGGGEPEGLAGVRLADAFHLKQHLARQHARD